MTRKIDHRRLGRLRQGQGEIANHIIDEFAAGRLSRRDFIRRATVVGISAPALGSTASGRQESAKTTVSPPLPPPPAVPSPAVPPPAVPPPVGAVPP